ncbi:MAG: hypothetical protein ACPHL6_09180 [Rubripirellula sp.]
MAIENPTQANQIDDQVIQQIAEKVVAQLVSKNQATDSNTLTATPSSKTNRSATLLETKVVAADQLIRLASHTSVVLIRHDAVITPAAVDEAKLRGLEITRVEKATVRPSTPAEELTQIIDHQQPERATAVALQLQMRGIGSPMPRIVLSETPARTLHEETLHHGQVAAMVGSIDEVTRFAKELSVTTWVLDMKRLSLISAVNVAAVIARKGISKT